MNGRHVVLLAAAAGLLAGTACRKVEGGKNTIILAAYTVPKEAYEERIIPAFRKFWKEKTGQDVEFQTSYEASGAQARAIVGGLEADVAALSLEGDVDTVTKAGLIKHDWKDDAWGGMVTASVVVIGLRPGNPKQVRGWEDLTRADVAVLTPDPATSGGAMWDICAVWGAALRAAGGTEASATDFLGRVRARVVSLDKSGRESMATFERGVGDAVITYENELLLREKKGRDYDFVLPASTIRIDNPVALVDANVDKHGNRELVEAFVAFLRGPEAQRAFAEYGFRPVLPEVAAEVSAGFPVPADLFAIGDLGGWTEVKAKLFSPEGIWARVNEAAAGR